MQPPRPPNPQAGTTRAAIATAMAAATMTPDQAIDLAATVETEQYAKAAAAVTKARSILIADYPWFGTLATRLHAKPAPFIGTLGTDGTRLLYAPAFVNKQPPAELLGGIAHEVLHCGLLHPYRFSGHDHAEWNIACDYAINGILIDAGFTLPKGSLYKPEYRNMSAEQIYAKRRAEAAANPPPPPPPPPGLDPDGDQSGGDGPGDDGDDGDDTGDQEDGDTGDEEDNSEEDGDQAGDEPTDEEDEDAEEDGDGDGDEEDEPEPDDKPQPPRPGRPQPEKEDEPEPDNGRGRMLPAPEKDDQAGDAEEDGEPKAGAGPTGDDWDESDWMVATAEATMLAAKAGKQSAGADRAATATREPVTDWREVLRRFIEQATSRDQSWTTPNRRYIANDLYLPGNTPTDAPRLGVLVDTSGSIDRDCLNQFASELQGIMREVRPEAVDVVYCDPAVAGVQEFTPDGEPLELTPAGGGGTDMGPGFAWFDQRAEEGLPVCAVVCFTDLDFWSIPAEPDGYPVLWVAYPWVTATAPWGETVRLNG